MRRVGFVTIVMALGLVSALAESKSRKNDSPKATPQKVIETRMTVNPHDAELMRKIRERIDRDGAISLGARKIRVNALNGRVVLSGPVSNEFDKTTVEHIAETYVGGARVTDELTVE
jgi:osmotically-inducible protein OsmY